MKNLIKKAISYFFFGDKNVDLEGWTIHVFHYQYQNSNKYVYQSICLQKGGEQIDIPYRKIVKKEGVKDKWVVQKSLSVG